MRPNFLITFTAIGLIAGLLSLGFWQLERADWRHAQQQLTEERQQLTPLHIAHFPEGSLTELAGRQVRLRGRFLEQQFLLDNQVHNHQPGFRVLTPFETDTHRQIVLVDRGWIAQGDSRQQLPDIRLTPRPANYVEGQIHLPQINPFVDTEHLIEGDGWPRIIQSIDYAPLAAALSELTLVPAVVRLGPDQPQGYLRQWPKPPMTAEKHTGYAVQWFAMAGMVLILIGLYWMRRR